MDQETRWQYRRMLWEEVFYRMELEAERVEGMTQSTNAIALNLLNMSIPIE